MRSLAKVAVWFSPLFLVLSSLTMLSGCGGLPLPAGGEGLKPTVRAEPPADLASVPRVLRLTVSGVPAGELFDIRLFEGELSKSHLKAFLAGDPPESLLERQVPCARYVRDDLLVVAPLSELAPETGYSLVSRSHGLLAELQVAPDSIFPLARVWPPEDREFERWLDELAPQLVGESEDAQARDIELYAVYCGDDNFEQPLASSSESAAASEVVLEPAGLGAEFSDGVGGDQLDAQRCLTLRARGTKSGSFALPPPIVGTRVFDPSPLDLAVFEPPSSAVCSDNALQLGPSCASVFDDRLIIEPSTSPWLWVLAANELTYWGVTSSELGLSLNGLAPEITYELSGQAVDPHGGIVTVQAAVTTLAEGEHVVLNEVYADPIGPEPAQEWVELVNDGISSVNLGGYVLEDTGGSTLLPAVSLEPDQFAVVVGADFAPQYDLAPAIDSIIVRVSAIGQGGLSNSGEQLKLFTPDGQLTSEFPMLPKPKEGVSVARRLPTTLDNDPNGFGLHAEPGASPGSANRLAD